MYKNLPHRLIRDITPEEISAYESDSATAPRGVLPIKWIEIMRDAVENFLNGPAAACAEYTEERIKGRYYGDFFIWWRNPVFKAFMEYSPMPEIADRVMKSQTLKFFYDQPLVKDPNTAEVTPCHQDLSYWPMQGKPIISIWTLFDSATQEYSRQFGQEAVEA